MYTPQDVERIVRENAIAAKAYRAKQLELAASAGRAGKYTAADVEHILRQRAQALPTASELYRDELKRQTGTADAGYQGPTSQGRRSPIFGDYTVQGAKNFGTGAANFYRTLQGTPNEYDQALLDKLERDVKSGKDTSWAEGDTPAAAAQTINANTRTPAVSDSKVARARELLDSFGYASSGQARKAGLERYLAMNGLSQLEIAAARSYQDKNSSGAERDIPTAQKLKNERSQQDQFLDGLQLALDMAGLVPGAGEVADGANALISAARGDYVDAALSAASMIPFAGWIASLGKGGKYALNSAEAIEAAAKYGDEVAAGIRAATKYGDDLVEGIGTAAKYGDDLIEGIGAAAKYGDDLAEGIGAAAKHGDEIGAAAGAARAQAAIPPNIHDLYLPDGPKRSITELDRALDLPQGDAGVSGLLTEGAGEIKLPSGDSQIKHIFRDAEGHLPDTLDNRNLLESVVNNKKYYLGSDKYGTQWYAWTRDDGTQVWVRSRKGTIINGGLNKAPVTFNPETGLNANPYR